MDLKQEYINRLLEISQTITLEDRKAAADDKFLGLSAPTINRYLSGDIVKIDTAELIIAFFSKRISERAEVKV